MVHFYLCSTDNFRFTKQFHLKFLISLGQISPFLCSYYFLLFCAVKMLCNLRTTKIDMFYLAYTRLLDYEGMSYEGIS